MIGVYNTVAPEYITNKDFTKLLAETIHRPLLLPNVPSIIIKLILGDMAKIVLEGSRISTKKLLNSGYSFMYPDLKSALNSLLKK